MFKDFSYRKSFDGAGGRAISQQLIEYPDRADAEVAYSLLKKCATIDLTVIKLWA